MHVEFGKRDNRHRIILLENFKFSFDVELLYSLRLDVILGSQFTLNERFVVKGFSAEQTDDKPYRFPVGFQEIVIALPHSRNGLHCTRNSDNGNLLELPRDDRILERGKQGNPPV